MNDEAILMEPASCGTSRTLTCIYIHVYLAVHPQLQVCRWLSSADVLQVDLPLSEDWAMPTCVPGVTPQTLSTHIARQLAVYLTARFHVPSWTGYLLDVNWEKVCAVCTGACLPHAAVII